MSYDLISAIVQVEVLGFSAVTVANVSSPTGVPVFTIFNLPIANK